MDHNGVVVVWTGIDEDTDLLFIDKASSINVHIVHLFVFEMSVEPHYLLVQSIYYESKLNVLYFLL